MSANSQRRQRHLLGRLEHHAVVGGHAGHHLVRHLVHRVVERRDGGDDAQQRLALGVARGVALPCGVMSQAEALAVVAQRLQAPNISTSATRPASYSASLTAQAGLA
jgi:sulfite exporter TauE/SafE